MTAEEPKALVAANELAAELDELLAAFPDVIARGGCTAEAELAILRHAVRFRLAVDVYRTKARLAPR